MACSGIEGLHVSQELPQGRDTFPQPTELHHSSVDGFESAMHVTIIR